MTAESRWNEMLGEFRALGGTAENIRLGNGPFGRGLFPVDPAKRVVIGIPESLLVRVEDVVFEQGVFRVSAASTVSARGRTFLEQYQSEFSWGSEGRAEIERFLETMRSVPGEIVELLVRKYHLGKFYQPFTPETVQTLFIDSRSIDSGGGRVIMPIIELANHGPLAGYETTGGVLLRGTFREEVLVRYCPTGDPYGIFLNWMFAPEDPAAFSIAMLIDVEGKRFRINRKFDNEPAPWVPKVSTGDGEIIVSYLLLGHRHFPRIPKGGFQRAMSNAGVAVPDETYDLIQHANRRYFLELIGLLEKVEAPAARPLRSLARCQLAALSYHYGLRLV